MDAIPTKPQITSDLDPNQPEIEAPTKIHPAKPISFSNGKRYHQHPPPQAVFKECLKNHAASIGGHALDGCGEFMPSPSFNSNDPTSLTCAACGCHRNFHRREEDQHPSSSVFPAIEFRPHNRHQLPPPPPPVEIRGADQNRPVPPNLSDRPCEDDDDSVSPPPISSSYTLLALGGGGGGGSGGGFNPGPMSRKRFRTKFSQYQKERMFEFAERVEWRMPKADDVGVKEFCREIGVDKSVFKVWMHNNKMAKKANVGGVGIGGGGGGGEGESRESGVVPVNGSLSST